MQFASPIPWWAALLAGAAVAAIAYASYRRPRVPLSAARRAALSGLRAVSLGLIVFFLCRPVLPLPPVADGDLVVPVLVDASRSMRIPDAGGGATRLERAVEIVNRDLLPSLTGAFVPEIYAVAQTPAATDLDRLRPDGIRSHLAEAVETIRERYQGRRVPGIVLISDGSTTGKAEASGSGPPIVAIGVGATAGLRDREVAALSAGDPRIDQTTIDLRVAVVSRGGGREPLPLRILANGRLVESRTLTPGGEGSPIDVAVAVSPDPSVATVYTAEVGAADGEAVVENNSRSVLVSPIGRKRRVLAVAGAPGYDFSFLSRALGRDPGLELDSIVRKGRNERGEPTFLVQAGGGRSASLTSGFPADRDALFGYDALVLLNVEGDFYSRAQWTMAADFVSVRGGGVVALGGRSFGPRGLIGTPLEDALPLELADRRGGSGPAPLDGEGAPGANLVALTPEGEAHPATRIGRTPAESRQLWAALPALAASAPVGGPRPGATVLAVTTAPTGARLPVIAVQRYGRGRTMIFGGEASWRWRMLLPAADRSYEHVWRQAVRWLALPAPEAVSATLPDAAEPGATAVIEVEARDAAFVPAGDAVVSATIAGPGGDARPLALVRDPERPGRFVAQVTPAAPGLYRVQGEARRGVRALGRFDGWFHAGGADRELADPRLNEGFLRRLALGSGGAYLPADEAGRAASHLRASIPATLAPAHRDLWHEPWAFALVVALLSAEWVLRRRWGLR